MRPLGRVGGYLCMAIPPGGGEGGAQHVDSPKSFLKNVAVSLTPGPENLSQEGAEVCGASRCTTTNTLMRSVMT
jgi:hypothetical protein